MKREKRRDTERRRIEKKWEGEGERKMIYRSSKEDEDGRQRNGKGRKYERWPAYRRQGKLERKKMRSRWRWKERERERDCAIAAAKKKKKKKMTRAAANMKREVRRN